MLQVRPRGAGEHIDGCQDAPCDSHHRAAGDRRAMRSAARCRARQPDWAENVRQEWLMRLEPLYRIRFTYPESWGVGLDGGWQQMFFIAEGRCEGSVTGR